LRHWLHRPIVAGFEARGHCIAGLAGDHTASWRCRARGSLIGLNRDLHGKPIGLKTLGLVGLATAMVVLLADPSGAGNVSDPASRVIQGILTGIGFLGAGVIVRAEHHFRIRGLTSAACTWLAACVGIACGLGQWRIVAVAVAIAFILLTVGRRLERWLHQVLGDKDEPDQKPAAPVSSPDTPAP
jgi:putative Mg2+ transporter-C (MgtC) family protein